MSKAAATKQLILQKSFDLIYKNGYQATSIDEIIATTQLTKGAFYYHFKTKEDMGMALIDEIFYAGMLKWFVRPLESTEDVTETMYHILHGMLMTEPFFTVAFGCPVMNLIEEMCPVSAVFKKGLGQLIIRSRTAIESAFRAAQERGEIRADIDCSQVAAFLISGYSGARNLGKLFGKEAYIPFLGQIRSYLENLK